ncbi:hypothetical protein B6D87_08510 [Pseudomonas fragi]|nr:hypothetical protein B6D87_08510 [Pseudomonas fragi]PAA29673.1 hypothetical protein CJU73_07170 [Pseudomonas fragi]
MWERACSRWHRRVSTEIPRRLHREQARSHKGLVLFVFAVFTGMPLTEVRTQRGCDGGYRN